MRTVPRHLFLPDENLETAYADRNIATKTGPNGECLSSASTPSIVAVMLEQLDAHPGHRVLEIGAGTGYNAALLTELGAEVTTVDIDPDAAAHTRTSLERAGITGVHVVESDGEQGFAPRAPYDRIIVTAGAWDLPEAWLDQLAEGGLLVVPLRFRGTTRAIAFQHHGDRLVSRSVKLCGFIPMRNDDGERDIGLGGGVILRCDEDQDITQTALTGVLDRPKHKTWSGVDIGAEPLHGIWGRLAVYEAGTCRIAAPPGAVESARATPAIPMLSPAVVEGGSLAYLAHRPTATKGRSELGAIGHGPGGEELCARLVEHIRAWDKDRSDRLVIAASASEAVDGGPTGRVITKRHVNLFLDWEGNLSPSCGNRRCGSARRP